MRPTARQYGAIAALRMLYIDHALVLSEPIYACTVNSGHAQSVESNGCPMHCSAYELEYVVELHRTAWRWHAWHVQQSDDLQNWPECLTLHGLSNDV